MLRTYHGCFRKNHNGTNRIIAKNEQCLVPTSRAFLKYIEDIPFLKYIEDIPCGIRTRSQYKKQKLVNRRTYETYFRNKRREDIERWLTANDLDVRVLKESDYFYVLRQTI